jgi:ribosomal protein S18 acetylase RimI-like enzyme
MNIKIADLSEKNKLISFFKHYKNNQLAKKRLDYFHTIIAKDKDKIVGMLQWQIKENPNLGVIEFEEMFILENYRNQGIGSKLLEFAIKSVKNYFKKLKIKPRKIYLFVDERNEAAINLYKKFGFVKKVNLGKLFSEKNNEILLICKI